MSFSCTIKAGKKELTGFNDETKPINYQLFGLAPNTQESTEAPYRLEDFRSVVANWPYPDKFKGSAVDCFKELQEMAKKNLESLKQEKHCDSCNCQTDDVVPKGWSVDAIKRFLSIDADSITYIHGGY